MASRRRHSQKHDEDDHTEETSKKSRHVMRNAKGKATTQDNMGDEPSEASASKESLSKRPPRGPTSMHCLSIQRVEGVKKDVELNSYTCIAVYIWYLYTRLERENKLKRFRFVDPYGVGYVAWTKKGKDALNEQTEERARSLANRLIGTLSDQIVVVPCNVGEHWILTVIDPHKEHVYILDPLYTRIKDESWKKAVDLAIKMFNVDVQRKGRKQVKWEIIRGPSQPDAYQCGFYVMRYMRQLVDLDVSVDLDSLQLRFIQEEYSKEEIDEVRSEWATCVQRHVQEY